jgi:hypothetical protein
VPQDINRDSSVKSTLAGGESLRVDKPLSPQAEKTVPDSPKPSSPKGVQDSPGAGNVPTSPTLATLDHDPASASSLPGPTKSPKASPPSPWSHGVGLPLGRSVVRDRWSHSLRRFRDSVHRSQSSYGTI